MLRREENTKIILIILIMYKNSVFVVVFLFMCKIFNATWDHISEILIKQLVFNYQFWCILTKSKNVYILLPV